MVRTSRSKLELVLLVAGVGTVVHTRRAGLLLNQAVVEVAGADLQPLLARDVDAKERIVVSIFMDQKLTMKMMMIMIILSKSFLNFKKLINSQNLRKDPVLLIELSNK